MFHITPSFFASYSAILSLAIFTNLSKDHIGPNEHSDFNNYLECKGLLFKQCKLGIFNVDDEGSLRMIKDATCKVETFGLSEGNDLRAENIKFLYSAVLQTNYLNAKNKFATQKFHSISSYSVV